MMCSMNSSMSPYGNIAGPFGFLLADVNGKIGPQQLDYTRPEGISDHPELPDDDGSDCAEAMDEY